MSDSGSEEEEKAPSIEEEAPPVSVLLESEEEEIPATPKAETKTRLSQGLHGHQEGV